jgi:hypothetical protein
MIGFCDMIRLVLTTITVFLFVLGTISKHIQASELLNHVTEEHHEHAHPHAHNHVAHSGHHGDDSDDTPQTNHSHSLEMSLLTFSLNVISSHGISVSVLGIQINQSVEGYQGNLNVRNFSSEVFRPPIV